MYSNHALMLDGGEILGEVVMLESLQCIFHPRKNIDNIISLHLCSCFCGKKGSKVVLGGQTIHDLMPDGDGTLVEVVLLGSLLCIAHPRQHK